MEVRSGMSVILGAGFAKSLGGCSVWDLDQVIEAMIQRPPDPMFYNTRSVRALERLVSSLKIQFKEHYNFEVLLGALEAALPFRKGVPYVVHEPDAVIRSIATLTGYDAEELRELMDWTLLDILSRIDTSMHELQQEPMDSAREFFAELRNRFAMTVTDLNYDDCSELVLERYLDGFVGEFPRRFDAKTFMSNVDETALMHLHGSRHMRFVSGQGFSICDPSMKLSDPLYIDTMTGGIYTAIISGTAKLEKMVVPPFSLYLHRFVHTLLVAPRVLIIGYGGSDIHLNQYLALLKEVHGQHLRLCIVTNRDIKDERPELQGIAAMAAGYAYRSQEAEFFQTIAFDEDGISTHPNLLLCRGGFPPREAARTKIAAFLT